MSCLSLSKEETTDYSLKDQQSDKMLQKHNLQKWFCCNCFTEIVTGILLEIICSLRLAVQNKNI